jgi:hypothetical protein
MPVVPFGLPTLEFRGDRLLFGAHQDRGTLVHRVRGDAWITACGALFTPLLFVARYADATYSLRPVRPLHREATFRGSCRWLP